MMCFALHFLAQLAQLLDSMNLSHGKSSHYNLYIIIHIHAPLHSIFLFLRSSDLLSVPFFGTKM